MKTIQIQNSKATYEGLEIENFKEVLISIEGETIAELIMSENTGTGSYPLPEGWDVINKITDCPLCNGGRHTKEDRLHERCLNCNSSGTKQIARLIRKEQKHKCQDRCDWPNCTLEGCIVKYEEQNSAHGYSEGSEIQPTIYTERAVELSDKTQPNALTKEELRKEFFQKLKESQGFLNSLNWFFDWFYSKLLTYQQEIDRLKKELEYARKSKNIPF